MSTHNAKVIRLHSNIESLKFESLEFGFEGQDPIFVSVDFSFPMNQTVWVKAHSGTGRSSLLQILAGVQVPNKGKYLINDHDVTEMSFEEFLPWRLNIGYGFDFGGLINNRTLKENCLLPLLYHKICTESEANERVESLFSKLDATKFLNQRPALVPGGIRKLTCLMRSVITEPDLLLLDDPTVGLSQEVALKFFDHIQELRNKKRARHVFISSFDEKIMNLIPHTEIFIDEGLIHSEVGSDKKVVHL